MKWYWQDRTGQDKPGQDKAEKNIYKEKDRISHMGSITRTTFQIF
jgi:hypothetical protein